MYIYIFNINILKTNYQDYYFNFFNSLNYFNSFKAKLHQKHLHYRQGLVSKT